MQTGTVHECVKISQEPPEKWMEKANCLDIPIEIFFPDKKFDVPYTYREAKKICDACEVKYECLLFSIKNEGFSDNRKYRHGMYGGMTPEERAKMTPNQIRKLRKDLKG